MKHFEEMNLAEQLVLGSREIDRMRIALVQGAKIVTGIMSHIELKVQGIPDEENFIEDEIQCEGSAGWCLQWSEGEYFMNFYIKDSRGYDCFEMPEDLSYQRMEQAYKTWPIFLEKLGQRYPKLAEAWKPFLDAAKS